jgi:hypothetical protein
MHSSKNENALTAPFVPVLTHKRKQLLDPSDPILVLLYRSGCCFYFVARILVVDTTISMLCT